MVKSSPDLGIRSRAPPVTMISRDAWMAASFPKYRPLPLRGSCMTLFQANAEAVQRHYRLPTLSGRPRDHAYLTSHGAGTPISPELSRQPSSRPLRALAESVALANALRRWCRSCTTPAPSLRRAAFSSRWNGQVESLERFSATRPELPRLGLTDNLH